MLTFLYKQQSNILKWCMKPISLVNLSNLIWTSYRQLYRRKSNKSIGWRLWLKIWSITWMKVRKFKIFIWTWKIMVRIYKIYIMKSQPFTILSWKVWTFLIMSFRNKILREVKEISCSLTDLLSRWFFYLLLIFVCFFCK